jgi:hypothetical protein
MNKWVGAFGLSLGVLMLILAVGALGAIILSPYGRETLILVIVLGLMTLAFRLTLLRTWD